MIKVEFKKPIPSVAFDDWLTRCEAQAHRLRSAADVSEKLYKEQRQAYLELFHGKCAYCEAKLVLDQHLGDVEHYRPKGRVTDEQDNTIQIDDGQGHNKPHPGYYWLAYDWHNLLPSCIACNRPSKIGQRRVGKWNRFPVAGKHASTPAEIAQEQPLLLNPLIVADDPAEHLEFDRKTGRIIGKTDRGRMTEAVLNLNREGLPEARREVFDSVLAHALKAFSVEFDLQERDPNAAGADNEDDSMTNNRDFQILRQHACGQAAYSMAGRMAIAFYQKALQAQQRRLNGR